MTCCHTLSPTSIYGCFFFGGNWLLRYEEISRYPHNNKRFSKWCITRRQTAEIPSNENIQFTEKEVLPQTNELKIKLTAKNQLHAKCEQIWCINRSNSIRTFFLCPLKIHLWHAWNCCCTPHPLALSDFIHSLLLLAKWLNGFRASIWHFADSASVHIHFQNKNHELPQSERPFDSSRIKFVCAFSVFSFFALLLFSFE